MKRRAAESGYELRTNEAYFVGFGSASNAYKVYKDDKMYVLKFYWGGNLSLFQNDILGYLLAYNTALNKYMINYYIQSIQHNQGLIIMDYAGITLNRFFMSNPLIGDVQKICEQLKDLQRLMEQTNIYHFDLHENNLTVKDGKLHIIDYEELRKDSIDEILVEFHPNDYYERKNLLKVIIQKYCSNK